MGGCTSSGTSVTPFKQKPFSVRNFGSRDFGGGVFSDVMYGKAKSRLHLTNRNGSRNLRCMIEAVQEGYLDPQKISDINAWIDGVLESAQEHPLEALAQFDESSMRDDELSASGSVFSLFEDCLSNQSYGSSVASTGSLMSLASRLHGSTSDLRNPRNHSSSRSSVSSRRSSSSNSGLQSPRNKGHKVQPHKVRKASRPNPNPNRDADAHSRNVARGLRPKPPHQDEDVTRHPAVDLPWAFPDVATGLPATQPPETGCSRSQISGESETASAQPSISSGGSYGTLSDAGPALAEPGPGAPRGRMMKTISSQSLGNAAAKAHLPRLLKSNSGPVGISRNLPKHGSHKNLKGLISPKDSV
uniref:Uncharacterized protein n=1 Tax=Eutreptiella gymnastica TaxID=73025 RepID=A0A7S1J0G3_9EUGL|mmetsp:Transcript_56242/g.100172  ORF Transcript_56242/g.100172 Transcript_56242/m.100172 type:complete len:358 (+) Transcript_56242:38-1111(+)